MDKDYEKLEEAFLDAYRNPNDIKRMLFYKLGENINNISNARSGLKDIFLDLIMWAESNGRFDDFLKAAHEYNPENTKLKKIYQDFFPFNLTNNLFLDEDQLNELRLILDAVNFSLLQKVCRKTINHLIEDVEGQIPEIINIDSISYIIEILLQKYPLRKDDSVPTILEFVQRLRDCDRIDREIRQKIQQWLKEIANDKDINLPIKYLKPKTISNKMVDSYLFVIVEEIEESRKFSLSAELIPNYQENNNNESITIELNKNSLNTCTLNEITKIIANFVQVAKKKLFLDYRYSRHNLIIELFLPYEYLQENIDLQEIMASGNQRKPLGSEYHFVVRCKNRYQLNYFSNFGDFFTNLENKWAVFQNIIQENAGTTEITNNFAYVSCIDRDCNWDEMLDKWEQQQKISVNLTCSLPVDGREKNFFLYLLKAGIPLSLWNRCSEFTCEKVEEEFNEMLNFASLANLFQLYKNIHQKRRDAHNKKKKASQYLGYHLGCLCDHPYRIPSSLNPYNGGDRLESYES